MSVIIEGLTLPKHNPKEIDKNVLIGYAIVKEDNTAELCLEGVHYLIKMLPTPHGRLIDADCLIKILQDTLDNYSNNYNDGKIIEKIVVDVCKQFIEHCPTIIEAEDDNE